MFGFGLAFQLLHNGLPFFRQLPLGRLPLAVVEGLLTVLIMMALENYAKPELKAIGFMKAGK